MIPQHVMLANLGGAVRQSRKVHGWTRRQLAVKSGVSERFLADIETGRGNPSLLRILDLATCLGTTPAALLQASPRLAVARGRVVALLGLRGAGKSSVGERLASSLGWRFIELDALVEEQAGLGLPEMFELHGQPYYRRMERQALESVLDTSDPVVVATGGGLVTEPTTFELLQGGAETVWLRASPEDHWERVVAQGDMRPMQGHDEAFAHLCAILEERERLYEKAHLTIDTSAATLEAVCGELVGRFASS
jgi:XRE family transcriptional regulator, aerobic/anaerobic benzoate catabolism transcriptional regulator